MSNLSLGLNGLLNPNTPSLNAACSAFQSCESSLCKTLTSSLFSKALSIRCSPKLEETVLVVDVRPNMTVKELVSDVQGLLTRAVGTESEIEVFAPERALHTALGGLSLDTPVSNLLQYVS